MSAVPFSQIDAAAAAPREPVSTDDAAARGSVRVDTVSALERGVTVLRAFDEDRQVLSPTELARLTHIPRPTVTRLATTLVTLGLLKQEPGSERFMLGPGVVSLARVFLAGLDIRAVARPHMRALAEAVGGSVYLALRDGLEMVLIEVSRPRSMLITARLDVGSRAPMANSALGRAYLAALDPLTRAALTESLRLARGSDWGRLESGLKTALADYEAHGYCISAGDFHPEINSVSVPLRCADGDIMALNCGSAAFVFGEEHLRRVVAPQLLAMSRTLEREIGGSPPAPRSAAGANEAPSQKEHGHATQ